MHMSSMHGDSSQGSLFQMIVTLFIALLIGVALCDGEKHEPTQSLPAGGISSDQIRQVDEIASLMDTIYTTLVKMRYIPQEAVMRPPHSPPIDDALAAAHHLDPMVIELLHRLPYVDVETAVEGSAFIFNSTFANYRDPWMLENSRDPFFVRWEDDGPGHTTTKVDYMRPWVIPLSLMLRNTKAAILYDVKKNHIWIVEKSSWRSIDPALQDAAETETKLRNRTSFDAIPSRPAPAVLKDIIERYISLEELPPNTGSIPLDLLRKLYLKHGWPENFDGDQFEIAKIRLDARESYRIRAELPLDRVKSITDWLQMARNHISNAQERLASATTLDEKYTLEWILKKDNFELNLALHALDHATQDVEVLCPRGVCMSEEEMIIWELKMIKRKMKEFEAGFTSFREMDLGVLGEEEKNQITKLLRVYESKYQLHEIAQAQSKKAVDELCLTRDCSRFPKKIQVSLSNFDHIRKRVESQREFVTHISQWLSELPDEAITAREQAVLVLEKVKAECEQKEAELPQLKEKCVAEGKAERHEEL